MPRQKINTRTPQIPTPEEVNAKIQELEKKVGIKKKVKPLGPGANPELWPGGPGVDTGDIALV